MAQTNDDEIQFDSLESLFGASIDDIADLPEYKVPPPGAYILKTTMSTKEINKKAAVIADFEVLETVELKEEGDQPVTPGTKFSTAFLLGNNVSTGRLKQFLVPFADKLGEKNVGVLVRDVIKDITISCQVTNRKDKDDPEKVYAGVKNVEVA